MKKVYSLIVILLIVTASIKAQNPFEELGVKCEVLTLSKGKYCEFFPNDTLIRIGTVIFNTITNQVVDLVVLDSTNANDLRRQPYISSRWMSPDPLAEKYYEISPYTYCANNPILFLDPNGMEIWLSYTQKDKDGNETTTKYQYRDNKLYTESGEEYDGSDPSDPIFQLVKDQLNYLKSPDGGDFGDLISSLESEDAITTTINIDPNSKHNNESADGFFNNNSKINYNPLDDKEPLNSSKEVNPMVGFIHELQHSSDRNISGDYNPNIPTTDINGNPDYIGYIECRAIKTENMLRVKLGNDETKTYKYGSVTVIVPKPYVQIPLKVKGK
jgi:hypothetical protein